MVNKEMAPEVGGGSNGADNIFKNMCIKLTGPSAEKIGEAFYGPGIVVLQEIKGEEKGAADAEDPGNSKEKEKELIINRIVRGALIQPPPGHGAEEGGEQVTEREGAMAGVKAAPVPPTRIIIAGMSGVGKTIKVLKQYRIVLLGKRGAGKSTLANTIFGEDVFKINHTPICGESECQTKSKSVHGRRITVVDTPGFVDTDRHEEEMKTWITGCSPGPHVFLIVLKLEKFTEQEKDVIHKMCQFFSEEALKYAAVVFTHGDQLPDGMKIEEFVGQEKGLSDLVKKCGGRCNVVDNKYRKNQVAELLSTIDKLVIENKWGCYTNKMVQAAERGTEETGDKESVGNMPEGDTNKTQNKSISKNIWIKLTGPAAKSMVEAFSSPAVVVLQDTAGPTDRAAEKVQAGKEAREGREGKYLKGTEEAATKIEDKEEETEKGEGDEDEAAPETGEEATTKQTEEEAATQTEEKEAAATEKPEEDAAIAGVVGSAAGVVGSAAGAAGGGCAAGVVGSAAGAAGGGSAAGVVGSAAGVVGIAAGVVGSAAGAAGGGSAAGVVGSAAGVVGSAAGVVGSAAGVVGSAAGAAGGGSAAGVVGSAAGVVGSAAGVVGSAAGAAGGGSAAGVVGVGAAVGIFVGGTITGIVTVVIGIAIAIVATLRHPEWAQKKLIDYILTKYSRRTGIILLVVAFFFFLLLSFCVQVPFAGTSLLWFGVLLMLLLSVALFLLL